MALTYLEQIELKRAKSLTNIPDLQAFILTGAIEYAADFSVTHKIFPLDNGADPPEAINQLANSYLSKILNLCKAVVRHELDHQNALGNSLQSLTAAYLGVVDKVTIGGNQITFTYSILEGAPSASWEEFLGIIMKLLFEIIAGVRGDERAAYNAI